MTIDLNNGELEVRIRENNGAIRRVNFGGSDFYNQGSNVSDFGLQVGTRRRTFVLNTTDGRTDQPVSVVAGAYDSSVIVTGTYTEGGANVDFTRTYSLIDGFNALQVSTEFVNNGSDLTLSYFDTFDPDQGEGIGEGFSTSSDVFTLSDDGEIATVGRASARGGLTVFTGSFDPEVTVASGSTRQAINSGRDLNLFFASPTDSNGAFADTGLDIGIRFDLDAGETQAFEYIQGYGESITEAQIQFLTIDPVLGTNSDDTLEGTTDIDIIDGLAGNDLIRGLEGDDSLSGNTGNDTLFGGEDNDSLFGDTGNDLIQGDSGNDNLDGGEGNDVIQGGTGNDNLEGSTGEDTISGADGLDSLSGGEGNDFLSGGDNRDSLEGDSGNDSITGSSGRDSLLGGDGLDTLEGNSGNDFLSGNAGADRLFGGNGNDNLSGNAGRDRLFGSAGDDFLFGGGANDTLRGGLGNDNLFGGDGDDLLEGGEGNDFLSGNAGADQFLLNSDQGGETITDFEDDLDKFVLGAGLSFDDLNILPTSGNTTITNSNNIVLAVVENISASDLDVEDFIF